MRLLEHERRRVLELAYQLGGLLHRDQLVGAAIEMLTPFLGADIGLLNDVDTVTGRVSTGYARKPSWHDEAFPVMVEVAAEHPMVRHYTTGPGRLGRQPVRIGDLVDNRRWRNSRTHRELFTVMQADHQLAIPMHTEPGNASGYAFNRSGRDFTSAHLARSFAVQPVLMALHAALPALAAAAPAADRRGLTEREYEVLSLLATGMTARAIARARCISERTVHRHLSNVYAKLGVHDRLSAVEHARRLGMLPPR